MLRLHPLLGLAVVLAGFAAGRCEPPDEEQPEDPIERLSRITPDETTVDYLAAINPRTGRPNDVRDRSDSSAPVDDKGKPLAGGLVRLNSSYYWGAQRQLALSPDGRTVAVGHCSGTIRLWSTVTGQPRGRLRDCRGHLHAMAYRPDGKTVATIGSPSIPRFAGHRHVQLFDLASGMELRTFEAAGVPQRIAFAPNGKTLAVGYLDGKVRLFPLNAEDRPRELFQGPDQVVALVFSPDGKTLLVWCEKNHARLFNPATGDECSSIPLWGQDGHSHVAFSADSRYAALGNHQGISVWDTQAQKFQPLRLPGMRDSRQPFAFAPDGKTLISTDRTGLHRWDVVTTKELDHFTSETGWPPEVGITADGRMLASTANVSSIVLRSAVGPPVVEPYLFLSPSDIFALSRDLDNDRIVSPYLALRMLTARPREPLWLWRDSLRPANAEPQRIKQLIADLDSNRFRTRQEATRALEELGSWAIQPLRAELGRKPPLEVTMRVERVLGVIDHPAAADRLLCFHGVRLLEEMGTPAARQALKRLADGSAGLPTGREAEAALKRLNDRP